MAERRKVSVGDDLICTNYQAKLTDGDSLEVEQYLRYLGQNGESFTLGYREVGGGRAREAYYDNAIYQHPAPGASTEIAFRKARVIVYSATNTEIEFEVVSGEDRI